MQDNNKEQNMENKEALIEGLAEDLLLTFKSVCPTDLTYHFINELTNVVELKTTPKGQFLKEKMIKTINKHLK